VWVSALLTKERENSKFVSRLSSVIIYPRVVSQTKQLLSTSHQACWERCGLMVNAQHSWLSGLGWRPSYGHCAGSRGLETLLSKYLFTQDYNSALSDAEAQEGVFRVERIRWAMRVQAQGYVYVTRSIRPRACTDLAQQISILTNVQTSAEEKDKLVQTIC